MSAYSMDVRNSKEKNKNDAFEVTIEYIPLLLQLGSTSLKKVNEIVHKDQIYRQDKSLQEFMKIVSTIIETVPSQLRQESDLYETPRKFLFSHLNHFRKRLEKQRQVSTEEYGLIDDLMRIYTNETTFQSQREILYRQKYEELNEKLKQRDIHYKQKVEEITQFSQHFKETERRNQQEKHDLHALYERELYKANGLHQENLESQRSEIIDYYHKELEEQKSQNHEKIKEYKNRFAAFIEEKNEEQRKKEEEQRKKENAFNQSIQSYKTTLEDYTEQIEHLKKELSEHQNKEQEYLDRLSMMMMSQEIGRSDANENLMDKYRPSVIKNQLRNLYVNDYGELDADLENQIPDTKTRSQLLLNILFGAFGICGNFVENQKKIVKDNLANVFTNHPFDKDKKVVISNHIHDTICNRLKESPDTQIFKKIKKAVFKQLNDKYPNLLDNQNELQMKSLSEYVDHCVEVTWRMKCCNPPLYITMETMLFDKRCHQKFDGDGQYIGYYLWPTLYSSEDHFKNNRPPYEKAEVVRTAIPHIDPINSTSEPSEDSSKLNQTATTQTTFITPSVSSTETSATTEITSATKALPTVQTTSPTEVVNVEPPSNLATETGFVLLEMKLPVQSLSDEDQDDKFHETEQPPDSVLAKPSEQKVGILAEQERKKKTKHADSWLAQVESPYFYQAEGSGAVNNNVLLGNRKQTESGPQTTKILTARTTTTTTTIATGKFGKNEALYTKIELNNSRGDNSGSGGGSGKSKGGRGKAYPGYTTRDHMGSGYPSGISNQGFSDKPDQREVRGGSKNNRSPHPSKY